MEPNEIFMDQTNPPNTMDTPNFNNSLLVHQTGTHIGLIFYYSAHQAWLTIIPQSQSIMHPLAIDFGRKILMYYYCAILSQHNGEVQEDKMSHKVSKPT